MDTKQPNSTNPTINKILQKKFSRNMLIAAYAVLVILGFLFTYFIIGNIVTGFLFFVNYSLIVTFAFAAYNKYKSQ